MKVIDLSKELGINIIEARNKNRFDDIKKLVNDANDDNVVLDLNKLSIQLRGQELSELVNDPRVSFIIHGDKDLYKHIKLIAILSGLDIDKKAQLKITKIEVEDPNKNKKDPDIQRVENAVVEEDGIVKINVASVNSVITFSKFTRALVNVAKRYDKPVEIDLTNVEIGNDELMDLIKLIYEANTSDGKDISIRSNRKEVIDAVSTLLEVSNSGVSSIEDKKNILDTEFPVNTVGILTSFSGRKGSPDIFGRGDNGRPVSNLPALYLRHDNEYAYFKSFRKSTFYTMNDWSNNNDGDLHPGLKTSTEKIPLKELGIGAYCVGTRYQFSLPVQFDKEGMIRTFSDWENGKVYMLTVTLPQYIKMVLDDFGIAYDYGRMSDCIRITKEELTRKGISWSK